VGLTEKRHALVSSLSGGMKRKLSVCLAFLGGSKVVLLDEPTSGMDPYSRRSTWQILQNAREGRVILLTTHFMDEAEILGDRIAIMDAGKVACSGTPAFLKDSYSLGYTLTVVCAKGEAGGASSDALTAITLAHVPGAKRVSSAGNEIKFRLASTSASAFPALLGALESHPAVVSLGMHVSSIEDIFMRIASHTPEQEEEVEEEGGGKGGKTKETQTLLMAPSEKSFSSYGTSSAATSSINTPGAGAGGGGLKSVRELARKELQPWEAFTIHTGAILVKRSRYARRDYCAVCCLLLVPVILLSLGLWLIQSGFQTTTLDFQLSTSQFNSPNFFASGGSGPTLIPAFTFTSASSSSPNSTLPPATNPNVTGFLGHFQVENATQGGAVLDGATAQQLDARNPYGFITSPTQPNRDLQRMSTYLLDDSRKHAASTFGALIFPGEETLTPPSGGGGGGHTLGILYNSTAVHSAPILLNLANTAALRYTNGSFPPGAPSSTPGIPSIATHSHALPYTAWELSTLLFAQTLAVVQVLLIATSFITPSFSLFIVREREVSAKHQQLISGVSIPAYWLANWAWDVFTYLLPAACCLIVLKAFGANAVLSTAGNRLPALLALFFLYGCSGAAYTHALTHAFSSPFVAGGVALFLNIIQLAGVIACAVLGLFSNTCKAVPPTTAAASLLPFFAFGTGLNRIFSLDTLGGPSSAPFICQLSNGGSYDKLPDYPPVTSAFAPAAAGNPLLYLALTTPLYFAISVALDYSRSDMALRSWLGKQFHLWMVALGLSPEGGGESVVRAVDEGEDEDVVREAQQAQEEGELAAQGWQQQGVGAVGEVGEEEEEGGRGGKSKDGGVSTILLSHLRKVFNKGKKTAVRDLSFRVEQGEVFGFLGINGAGKTTTLRMLTGDELPSSGQAWLAGYDIIKEQGQVRRLLGYCPQFDALLDLLTPREHLELYARIKGVPLPQLRGVVDSKLAEFDLLPFQNKITKSLSGGNKRKLSVAIALIGDPPVIFLDEPSTGVDPVAKRFMWRVINTIATERKSCSLILTTHSMEEVEALCSRIGIMVGGRLRCMGSAQHLRNRHGGGFTLDVLLPPPTPKDVEGVVAVLTGKGGAAVDRGGGEGWVLESSAIPLASSALGVEARAGEVREDGLGWVVHSALSQRGGALPVEDFARWWCEMNESEGAIAGATSVFPGAVLTERQTRALKFVLASATLSQGQRLSALFASVEILRGKLPPGSICTMGQYTLESVFNSFAAQQEEESTLAPGLIKG
jgi:ATP-binding cassette subfamily A (ABC1) protein 3